MPRPIHVGQKRLSQGVLGALAVAVGLAVPGPASAQTTEPLDLEVDAGALVLSPQDAGLSALAEDGALSGHLVDGVVEVAEGVRVVVRWNADRAAFEVVSVNRVVCAEQDRVGALELCTPAQVSLSAPRPRVVITTYAGAAPYTFVFQRRDSAQRPWRTIDTVRNNTRAFRSFNPSSSYDVGPDTREYEEVRFGPDRPGMQYRVRVTDDEGVRTTSALVSLVE